MQDRRNGGDDDRPFLALGGDLGQSRQGIDALGQDVPVRRSPVVWQAVPSWKCQDGQVGGEKLQGIGQPGHPQIVAGDMQDATALVARQSGDQQGFAAIGDATDVMAARIGKTERKINHVSRPVIIGWS